MIQHNLLLIFRNFKRFKTTFFINLIGLTTGLACTLLIYLWVKDELRMDRFHEKDARLFQVMEHQQHSGSIRVTDSTPWLLADALDEEMPEVEFAVVSTPTYWFGNQTLSVDNNPVKANGKYASKHFFNIFSYRLIEGKSDVVLGDKSSIVISRELARRLFNSTEHIVGRTIVYQQDQLFKVSGVFEDLPANSSEYFDFVLPIQLLMDRSPEVVNWGNSGPQTFVVLSESADVKQFRSKVEDFIRTKSDAKHRKLLVTKFSDGYLFGNYENGVQAGGRIEYVTLFSIVAIFILLIACINFMNLSTARAARRIKEVGIKKVVGAERSTLVVQYLAESLLMAFMAVLLAVLLVDILLPKFNEITGKNLELILDVELGLSLLMIGLITGIVAGSYPALYLSGFNPAAVLKGKLDTTFGEVWARKGLVVFQFTLSVILIVCVLVVYEQIQFVQNKNLGYDKDNVIYFPNEGKIKAGLETFIAEMNQIPGVVKASSIAQSMIGGGNTTEIEWEGKDPETRIPFAVRPVNHDIIEMLDLEIVEGRSFSREFITDTAAVIFNEAGIEAMGISDPVGKQITMGNGWIFTIIGVVKNFHYESLHTSVAPLFFALKPQYTETIIAKVAAGQERETLERIREFYVKFNPGFPFVYRFLDADYQALYDNEIRVSILSRYFAGIAILISCLGLFGLAAFTAERRRKEIGIRKVLGSSEIRIVYLLSGDFSVLVGLSILIALPVSYLLTKQWLDNFVFRISLHWWYFLAAGALALIIAWLTVGMQAVRAARVNPTRCLRDE
jgi:predicted permease